MKANNNFSNLNSENINLYISEFSERTRKHNEVIQFINSGKLAKILDYITINDYCIGGTVALIGGYKIPIPREEIKDIDVIVPAGTIHKIEHIIRKDPFFKVIGHSTLVHSKEYCKNTYNEHLEFRCAEGPAIDIVERERDSKWDYHYTDKGCPLCPLEVIINTKKKWGRKKDINDLKFISKYFELFRLLSI